jgi:hypothetical protein
LYVRFPGPRARHVPPGTIQLATRSDDRLTGPLISEGNNWFGKPSTDLVARPDQEDEVNLALDFVRRANQLYRPRARRQRKE